MAGVEYKYIRFDYLKKQFFTNGTVRFNKIIDRNYGAVGSKDKPVAKMNPFDPAPILPGALYLGSAYGGRDIKVLRFHGITHVVNVSKNIPYSPYEREFETLQIKADDLPSFDLRKYFELSNAFIDEALENGGRVFVHCSIGKSRSTTIVLAYLMYKFGWSLPEAYQFVKQRRSEAEPNPGFMAQLFGYSSELSNLSYVNRQRYMSYVRAHQHYFNYG